MLVFFSHRPNTEVATKPNAEGAPPSVQLLDQHLDHVKRAVCFVQYNPSKVMQKCLSKKMFYAFHAKVIYEQCSLTFYTVFLTVVNSSWRNWGSWGSCSKTCGGGVRSSSVIFLFDFFYSSKA